MEQMITTQEEIKEMKEFEEDRIFLEEHKSNLRKKFPNKWVAIYNKQLVAVADDLESLIDELKNKNISPSKAVVEFLPTDETVMILVIR